MDILVYQEVGKRTEPVDIVAYFLKELAGWDYLTLVTQVYRHALRYKAGKQETSFQAKQWENTVGDDFSLVVPYQEILDPSRQGKNKTNCRPSFGPLVLPNKKKETLVFEDDLKDTHVIQSCKTFQSLNLNQVLPTEETKALISSSPEVTGHLQPLGPKGQETEQFRACAGCKYNRPFYIQHLGNARHKTVCIQDRVSNPKNARGN